MKKLTALLAIMLAAVTLFAAGTGEDKGGDSMRHVSIWMDDMTEDRQDMMEEIIAAFEAKYPDIKVDFTGLPGDATDKLMLGFEAGTGPDILNITSKNIATYIENGYVVDITDMYAEQGNDAILDSAIESATSFDRDGGRLYYLPSGTNFYCLWIRPDWFAEKGLALPETWPEFFDDVKALTDKDAGRYGIALRGGSGAATNLEMLMYSYSGITNYFDENGQCTVNDPRHVEFCEQYLGLYNNYSGEGDINYGWGQLAGAFQTGTAAIIQHNTGSAADHYKVFNGDLSKFAALPFPKSLEGTRVMQRLSWDGFAINSSCDDVDAAWKFVYFICAEEGAEIYNENIGLLPCVASILNDPESYVNDPEKPWMATGSEVILSPDTLFYDTPTYMPSYSSTLTSEIDGLVQEAMAGRISCQEMLDEWAAIMTELYAEEG